MSQAVEPQSPFVACDKEFEAVLGDAPRLVRVTCADAHEGPVYVPGEHALYFTTLPRDEAAATGPRLDIKRLDLDVGSVSLVRPDANVANGMALDLEGRLVVCEQGDRSRPAAITRTDRATGEVVERVTDSWSDQPLNSPNDVIVASDGSVWFTDPSYGWIQGYRPEPQHGDLVHRWDRLSGQVSAVADTLDKPNGLCLSPDESVLYVTDSGANQEAGSFYPQRPHHVVAFDVTGGGRLAGERVFAEIAPGNPDGIKVDSDGRVYASSFSGVQVFHPAGRKLGEVKLPGAVNFCFGGPERTVLYITADEALWAAHLAVAGPPLPKPEPPLKGA